MKEILRETRVIGEQKSAQKRFGEGHARDPFAERKTKGILLLCFSLRSIISRVVQAGNLFPVCTAGELNCAGKNVAMES